MYIVVVQDFKKNIVYTKIYVYKKKLLRYWMRILISKIQKRKVTIVYD